MTRQFSISIDIAAPPATVWPIMRDVERWHEWTASIRSIERLDHGPFAVGSRARVRQPKLPPAIWEVSDIQEGRGFTWTSRAPGLLVSGIHTVEPAGTGSRATLGLRYDGPLAALAAWLWRGLIERYIGMEAAGLKRRSEAR